MKNAFVRLISRFDTAEERISELKARSIESTQTEAQRKRESRTDYPRIPITEVNPSNTPPVIAPTVPQPSVWGIARAASMTSL